MTYRKEGSQYSDSGINSDLIEVEYKMCHKYRGRALIFNNEHFDEPNLRSREGTQEDSKNLERVLKQLRFKVKVYTDRVCKDIMGKIKKAAERDHTEDDCILIAILSHGVMGRIHARDRSYPLENIWSPFTADKCPTLTGKPKLFIIQACQGDLKDPGCSAEEVVESENKSPPCLTYRLPDHADFLIASSTIPGYCSWRNTLEGSWFIKTLCDQLELHGKTRDILRLLTSVAQRVAFDFESYQPNDLSLHRKKQIPCTMSTLTRILYFHTTSES